MPRTNTTSDKSAQVKASSAAKSSRIEEAGLRGRRKGKSLGTTQRAQAKRDAKAAAAEAKVARSAKTSTAKAPPTMKARRPAAGKTPAASRKRGPVLTVQVNTSRTVPGDTAFVAQARETIRTTRGHLAA